MEYFVDAVNLERRIATRFGSFKTRIEAETQCRVLKYGPWKSISVVEEMSEQERVGLSMESSQAVAGYANLGSQTSVQ